MMKLMTGVFVLERITTIDDGVDRVWTKSLVRFLCLKMVTNNPKSKAKIVV